MNTKVVGSFCEVDTLFTLIHVHPKIPTLKKHKSFFYIQLLALWGGQQLCQIVRVFLISFCRRKSVCGQVYGKRNTKP